MISWVNEITEPAFNASSGKAITRINPKKIIIEAEILINHLVTGSNSIQKAKV